MPETLYGEGAGAVPGRRDGNNVPGGHEEPRYHDGNTAEKGLPPAETDEKGTVPGKEKPSIAPPTALFDEKTIEKFALKESPLDKGLTFDTSEFKHRGYMKMLKEKIESMWQYPKEAARLGLSGDLYIKFSIRKDGRLADVELLRTSGYRELDEAAIKALKDSAPYWPLPSDWEKDTLEIKGHFIYVYGSSYVM
jgi:protein TonB